jgi:hypothetical protein
MNKKGIYAGAFIFILLIASVIVIFLISTSIARVCEDGTFYNGCSELKPYFCLNGALIKNTSLCGCPQTSKTEGNECISQYQFEPKEIDLNYTLEGKEGSIKFTVYKSLSDYLYKIPRYMQYEQNDGSVLLNFKLRSLDNEEQKQLLLPLAFEIRKITKVKDDQARIAISIVQNIPFGSSNRTSKFGNLDIDYYRYPYEVLYDMQGVCGEKSELLIFLLRELGYGSSFLYYASENHEAVGIKCPLKSSLYETGYCFVETTGPSIISDYRTEYANIGQLNSLSDVIEIPGNLTFGDKGDFYEFRDFKMLDSIRESEKAQGVISLFQHVQYQELKQKYGLKDFKEYIFE